MMEIIVGIFFVLFLIVLGCYFYFDNKTQKKSLESQREHYRQQDEVSRKRDELEDKFSDFKEETMKELKQINSKIDFLFIKFGEKDD